MNVVVAFLRRDFRINLSYRASFVLQLFAILFPLALFFYLGRVVDQTRFADQHQNLSGGYFGYVVVGLALLAIVAASLSSFSRKLREEQMSGTFEALMATPRSPSLIVLSSAAFELLRATVSGMMMIAAGIVLFGLRLDLGPGSIAVTLVALVGFLGLFASLGVAVAAFTVVIKQTAALLSMVVSGLAFFGGVYFPIEVLPTPLEQLAAALPFTWGLDVLRASLLGGTVDPVQLGGLLASAALLLPVALLGFTMAVRRARQTGSLAEY